jgi:putative transposase
VGGKKHTPEQIIEKLQSAERALAKDMTVVAVCRKLNITEQTFYRWRRLYGRSQVEQVKRLRELEKENSRLKKLLADQALHIGFLR